MLVINDPAFLKRAEIIREKGTNRSSFFRGEVDKYGWVDIGSSFLPSDVLAAFLFAQLEQFDQIQKRRLEIWNHYNNALMPYQDKGALTLPKLPGYATNNGHMFYVVCNTGQDRERLIRTLKEMGVLAVFHYLSLHKSEYYKSRHDGRELPWSDHYSDCLVRLPLFFELTEAEIEYVISGVRKCFN